MSLAETLKPSDIRISLTSFALANIYNVLFGKSVPPVVVAENRMFYINECKKHLTK